MKKIFFFGGLFFLLVSPFFVSAQTEVLYPSIPDILSPQEIIVSAESQEDVFPLFMAYIFSLLFVVSIIVAVGVVLYGGFLYITSGEDPERKKNAKSWILSAIQGTLIVFFSHTLLLAIDSRFVVFNLERIEEVRKIDKVDLTWTIKNVYFQIPFGLLIEDATINEKGRDKFYDILDAIYDVEDTADAILHGGRDLLEIIDICPEVNERSCRTFNSEITDAVVLDGETIYYIGACPEGDFDCCESSPFCSWPPIPFSMLIRPKETRPILECWWNERARRSNTSARISRPPLLLLSRGEFDYYFLIDMLNIRQRVYAELRVIIKDLKTATEDFFPPYLSEKDSLWDLKRFLIEITMKIEEVLREQKRATELTEALRKIGREVEELREKYPEIQESPLKEPLEDLAVGWTEIATIPKGDLGYNEVPFVDQGDIAWRHFRYNWGTFGHSGCAIAATVMVFRHYGVGADIFEATRFAVRHGYSGPFGGTMMNFVPHIARSYGLNVQHVRNPSSGHLEYLARWLENEGPVVIGGADWPWSSSPFARHALTLTGADRGKGLIYISNTSFPYQHAVSFAEVRANMPTDIVYISNGKSAQKDCPPENFQVLGSNGGCGECPEIACALQNKLSEIYHTYMQKNLLDLWVAFWSKDLQKEDLYNLYKAIMLKSLGEEHLINYPSLLLQKSYYDAKKEILIESSLDFTKIHRFDGSGKDPYIWNWQKWIDNILYKTDIDCTASVENDPVTFYLPKPDADKVIRDALIRMAYRRNQSDIQYTEIKLLIEEVPAFSSVSEEVFAFMKEVSGDTMEATLEGALTEKLNKYFIEGNIDPINVSEGELIDILNELGIDPEDVDMFDIRDVMVKHPSDYLTCGMEIPVGETFQIVWDHSIELLFAIDGYLVEGLKLLELQEIMNATVSLCSCSCCGPGLDCPPECGACCLTCDKVWIRNFYYEEIVPQRERLRQIANYIKHLTDGFFHDPTENVCDPLNEDIRGEEEKELCRAGGRRFITLHELVTRKLNYSRYMFDECITRPEHIEDALEWERAGKIPVFGPIAEKADLPRYTKTRKDGAVVNTHDFNWFCCLGSQLLDE